MLEGNGEYKGYDDKKRNQKIFCLSQLLLDLAFWIILSIMTIFFFSFACSYTSNDV